jgi:hypothetical protein
VRDTVRDRHTRKGLQCSGTGSNLLLGKSRVPEESCKEEHNHTCICKRTALPTTSHPGERGLESREEAVGKKMSPPPKSAPIDQGKDSKCLESTGEISFLPISHFDCHTVRERPNAG